MSEPPGLRPQFCRRFAALLLVGSAIWIFGCSSFGPSDTRVYSLSRVNGHPLPANLYEIEMYGGGTTGIRWDGGTLTLGPGSRFRREFVGHRTWNGVATDTIAVETESGGFLQSDSTVVIVYSDGAGGHRWIYRLSPDGKVLTGIEDYATLTLVRYEFIQQ